MTIDGTIKMLQLVIGAVVLALVLGAYTTTAKIPPLDVGGRPATVQEEVQWQQDQDRMRLTEEMEKMR